MSIFLSYGDGKNWSPRSEELREGDILLAAVCGGSPER